jgi:hypothetical protein
MESIDLEATRIAKPQIYRRVMLPVFSETALPRPSPLSIDLATALSRRRSADDFSPISQSDLADWLWYVASVQALNSDDSNRQQRFPPSLGGLHPAHIVLGWPTGEWMVYLPERHALGRLEIEAEAAANLRTNAQECFFSNTATLVVLVTDLDLVTNYYRNPFGLLLRDAGVLLGHAGIVAAGLSLTFRILGTNGSPFAERFIPRLPFTPFAAGLAWVGR